MQMKNKFLSIFLSLTLIMMIIPMGYISASAETRFSGGEGTSTNPFQISTEEDLKSLAKIVNNGNDCEGLFFKQTADITVTDFVPIGKYDDTNGYYYFNGTFDGGNNDINGTIGDEYKEDQALFGVVGSNGTIKNVTNNSTVTGDYYVGGVVSGNQGTIENCQNNGVITGTDGYVGGVVGKNGGTITNCYNTGAIEGEYNIGGVAGNNYGTITNCYNIGVVKGVNKVGGVTGGNLYTITNCYNTGIVEGVDSVGGVVGWNYENNTVTNCYNTGDIKGEGKYVSGVVGNNYGTITNCYNTGFITGANAIGGVAGANGDTIANCYNIGDITGVNAIGGIAGANSDTITNCYNTGAVEGETLVGGVVGRNFNVTITYCYYLSSIADKGVDDGVDTGIIATAPFAGDGTFRNTNNVYKNKDNLFDALNEWVSDNKTDEDIYTEWLTFGGYPILRPFKEDGTPLNPYIITTEENTYVIFISILVILAVAGVYVAKKKMRK